MSSSAPVAPTRLQPSLRFARPRQGATRVCQTRRKRRADEVVALESLILVTFAAFLAWSVKILIAWVWCDPLNRKASTDPQPDNGFRICSLHTTGHCADVGLAKFQLPTTHQCSTINLYWRRCLASDASLHDFFNAVRKRPLGLGAVFLFGTGWPHCG